MISLCFFIVICLTVYCCMSWVLPRFLAWLCKRKYRLDVEIGRIGVGLWYFTLRDVKLSKNHISVHIDEIGFRSSFFSSEVAKLLSVVIKELRIDVNATQKMANDSSIDQSIFNQSRSFSFHNQKIPPAIITFVQFMAIHVYNTSVMFLRAESPEWLIHASAGEIHLDGSIIHNARTLLVNVSVTSATAKLLKHAAVADPQTCLGELSFGVSLEATVIAQGPLSVEKLYLGMHNTQAVIQEAIYGFAQRSRTSSTNVIKIDKPIVPSEHFYDLLPIIPKNFNLNIENSMLNGMRDNSKVDFSATLQTLLINTQVNLQSINQSKNPNKELSTVSPQVFLSCKVQTFDVKCNKESVVQMSKLTIDGNYDEDSLNVYVILDTLNLSYEHLFMKPWVVNNFLKKQDLVSEGEKSRKMMKIEKSWFDRFSENCQISGCIELWKIAVWCHLPEEPETTSVGFQHMKFVLDKSNDRRPGPVYKSTLGKILFGKNHWAVEFMLESCWCRIGHTLLNTDAHMLKKYHTWGTPLFLGVALVKIRTQAENEVKVHTMVDLFRTEWSPLLVKFLEQCIKCAGEYRTYRGSSDGSEVSQVGNFSGDIEFSNNFACTNANFYWLSDNDICLMMRLDKLTLDRHKRKMDLVVEGVKVSPLKSTSIQHSCVRSEEIKSMCVHVKYARLNYQSKTKDLTVKLQEQIQLKWSANLHMKALTLCQEIKTFLGKLSQTVSVENPKEKSQTPLNWAVKVNGEFQMLISLSKKHEILLLATELAFGKTASYTGMETSLLKIAVDDADIFSVNKLQICRQYDDGFVRDERKRAEGLALETNKVWGVTADSFKACFPFEHNYATAVQGELVSTYKWLKLLHKKQKTPFTADSPLPSDLHIQLKEFLFEMSDDPFEVKLRDNYELLVDEYQESVKRVKMLDAKVAELSKTHPLFVTPERFEELYSNLSMKNAEIYIKRSRLMSRQNPMRTRLFAWCMSEIRIVALADPSYHGMENVQGIMESIDPDSPWPDEGVQFSTLWCRSIFASVKDWKFQLRDFPQPLLDIQALQVFGHLVGAEQVATQRARREVEVDLGEPFGSATVQRSMTTLKFYHDFNMDVEHIRYAFGPCWEPVIAQCNLSFEKISPPSRDPSPTMPWWDKMRLLFHGRLTMYTKQLTMLLHASLDPYNTTEEMELTWTSVAMDWSNAKFVFQGDFNVFVRTASKYDDCRLLHLPHLKLTLKLTWVCLADPNDHHAVMPCAPDKLPEYSSNQEHDSFRAFRSQNLNVSIALETKGLPSDADCPTAILYGSTLRWFENLKLILSGVTRPTRRGTIFSNLRPKKKPLSRHYRKVRVLIGIHRFQVSYWMSFAMQRGFELLGGRISFSSEHILNVLPIDDGLTHRPRAEWSVSYMNCDLNDAEIWLKSALQGSDADAASLRKPVEKCYCLSVIKVTYGREAVVSRRDAGLNTGDTPTHRLVVYDLKGAWTKSNRDVAFALFDTFMKSQQLKKNLSTESLKNFRGERGDNNSKTRTPKPPSAESHSTPKTSEALLTSPPATMSAPSPATAGTAASMLQQLIADVDTKPVVFCDDMSVQTTGQRLQGLQACQEDDVVYKNWLISLINSQVLLKGCETKGYVILSAAKAEILQRVHRPVWKDRTLVSKTTWVGSLECMQYYATVAAGQNDTVDENIMWLTLDNIQEKETVAEPQDVLQLVASGHSVGGVVTETVGATSVEAGNDNPIQLQRIVSRCKCEFFFAGYGETSIDPGTLEEVPPLPIDETGPWERKERAVDAFTLMHHDLDVCTNSLQYAMILDIVNHLLLYVEPQRKQLYERLQRLRFQLALHSTEDQRRPIQVLQNQVRSLVSKIRRLERETYLVQRALAETEDELLSEELDSLEKEVYDCKEQLAAQSEELDLMLSCYKESQLSANQKLAAMKGDKPATSVRANEIVFKHAQWRLTEADGQLGLSDLVLSNFLYTKNSKSDDSVEHLLELGYINMVNLLPNQSYKEVLSPTKIQSNMPVDRKTAVRVFCRERAPVGGISVMEHFEINVVPITIGLTKKFYNTMVNFCFPGRDPDNIDDEEMETAEKTDKGTAKRPKTGGKKGKDSNFYVKIDKKDDVEKMKERAEKNKLFIYIKIPEVPVRVSYKGNKEKNLEDIRDFSLVIPTLEYHNVTWTWLDLLLAMKTDSRRVILSQAIKQKLTIKSKKAGNEEGQTPQEEDKARMLLGARALPSAASAKGPKRGVLKFM